MRRERLSRELVTRNNGVALHWQKTVTEPPALCRRDQIMPCRSALTTASVRERTPNLP
jgi:hypothetical protein